MQLYSLTAHAEARVYALILLLEDIKLMQKSISCQMVVMNTSFFWMSGQILCVSLHLHAAQTKQNKNPAWHMCHHQRMQFPCVCLVWFYCFFMLSWRTFSREEVRAGRVGCGEKADFFSWA